MESYLGCPLEWWVRRVPGVVLPSRVCNSHSKLRGVVCPSVYCRSFWHIHHASGETGLHLNFLLRRHMIREFVRCRPGDGESQNSNRLKPIPTYHHILRKFVHVQLSRLI